MTLLSRPIFPPLSLFSRTAAKTSTGLAVSGCRHLATTPSVGGAGAPGHVTSLGLRVDTKTAGRQSAAYYGMFRRYAFGFPPVRQLSTMSSSTPIEDAIRSKVTAALQPLTFEIHNDSKLHSHHKPMAGNTSTETHFRLVITSEAFRSKMQSARHRMIYALLRDELSQDGGIHALQLRTLTPEEEDKQKAKAKEEEGEGEQQGQQNQSQQAE